MALLLFTLTGGTADFTCHEINPDNTLKELQKPSGGDYGGITVDHAFRKLLNALFGADIIEKFKESHMEEFYELFTRFEMKKRNFQGSDKMILQFPVSLLEKYEEEVEMAIANTIRSSPYRGRVEFKQDKMVIQLELAKEIFNEAISKIVEKITDLFKEVDNLQAVVLVGGFSESKFLRNTIMEKFQNKIRVIWPEEPSSAVIKGAVINGQQPKAIDSRVCKYTYGIGRMMKFKPYHPHDKLVNINGVEWCDDLFNKHIEIGQTVRLDDDFPAEEYFPVTDQMKQAAVMVYASSKRDPMFIDETGCHLIGLIRLELTGGDVDARVLVKLVFGGTELIVEAVEEQTGKTTVGHIDFLG